MFKGQIVTATAITGSTNIPFSVQYNSNANTEYDATTNTLKILKCGFYNIKAQLNATVSATANATIQLFANGSELPETLRTHNALDDVTVVPLITDTTILVTPANINQFANVSVQTTNVSSANSGIFIVERVR